MIIVCLGSSWPLALILIPSSTGKCHFSSIAMMLPIVKGTRVEDAASIIVWCLGVDSLGVSDSSHSSPFLPLEGRCYQHSSAVTAMLLLFRSWPSRLRTTYMVVLSSNTRAGDFHRLFLGFIQWELCEPSCHASVLSILRWWSQMYIITGSTKFSRWMKV